MRMLVRFVGVFQICSQCRVLFVSMHRYQYGAEWPYLRESDYDYIGQGPGKGYTINVPLNEVTVKIVLLLNVGNFSHLLV